MENIAAVFIDPEVPEIDYVELDFESQIKHTQRVKNRILHKLVVSNPDGSMPVDKDSVELMLKVADSMDKTTIARKRVSVDEKNGNSALSILTGIAEMVAKSGNANLFTKGAPDKANKNEDIGAMPDFTGEHASGESDMGVITETATKFSERMESVNKAEMLRREESMGLHETPTVV